MANERSDLAPNGNERNAAVAIHNYENEKTTREL